MKTEQLSKMSQDEIIAMFSGDMKFAEDELESMQVKVLAATCPTKITQGTIHTIKVARDAAKTGTPNYVYKWYLGETLMETYPTSGKTAATSHTFSHKFSEAVDSLHTIKGRITDSCATAKTSDESCTIKIIPVGEEEEEEKADMTPLIIGGTVVIILGAAYIMLRRRK